MPQPLIDSVITLPSGTMQRLIAQSQEALQSSKLATAHAAKAALQAAYTVRGFNEQYETYVGEVGIEAESRVRERTTFPLDHTPAPAPAPKLRYPAGARRYTTIKAEYAKTYPQTTAFIEGSFGGNHGVADLVSEIAKMRNEHCLHETDLDDSRLAWPKVAPNASAEVTLASNTFLHPDIRAAVKALTFAEANDNHPEPDLDTYIIGWDFPQDSTGDKGNTCCRKEGEMLLWGLHQLYSNKKAYPQVLSPVNDHTSEEFKIRNLLMIDRNSATTDKSHTWETTGRDIDQSHGGMKTQDHAIVSLLSARLVVGTCLSGVVNNGLTPEYMIDFETCLPRTGNQLMHPRDMGVVPHGKDPVSAAFFISGSLLDNSRRRIGLTQVSSLRDDRNAAMHPVAHSFASGGDGAIRHKTYLRLYNYRSLAEVLLACANVGTEIFQDSHPSRQKVVVFVCRRISRVVNIAVIQLFMHSDIRFVFFSEPPQPLVQKRVSRGSRTPPFSFLFVISRR
jgi:hypothetical protein